MKAARVLAAVLTALSMTGCLSQEKPSRSEGTSPRPASEQPAEESQRLVSVLLEAHHETVGQMRVSSSTLHAHPRIDCN